MKVLKRWVTTFAWFVVWVSLFVFGVVMPSHGAHTEEPEVYPDVMATFGCFEEQVALNLLEVWEAKGQYWFSEVGDQYMQSGECFFLYDPGYPAYVDRVVRKSDKKFEGEDAYVVEAHFLGAAPGKTFFFMYYGELPIRARRSAA